MNSALVYKNTLSPEDYNALRNAVGWEPLCPEQARQGLAGSAPNGPMRAVGRAWSCGFGLTFRRQTFLFDFLSFILDINSGICYYTFRGDEMSKNLRLKAARAERDMTQKALADAAGVSRQTINAIEQGEYNPTIRLCLTICRALGKTLDELFWEEN